MRTLQSLYRTVSAVINMTSPSMINMVSSIGGHLALRGQSHPAQTDEPY